MINPLIASMVKIWRYSIGLAAFALISACGSEISDVGAPSAVTEGVPFEIEVTNTFYDSDIVFAEDGDERIVFVFVAPPGWEALDGGTYTINWSDPPVNMEVEVLDSFESGWAEFMMNIPECVDPVEPDFESDCAVIATADITNNPFFYGGPFAPPEEGYQLIYARTTEPLNQTPLTNEGDTGTLTLPFRANGISPGEAVVWVGHGVQASQVAPASVLDRIAEQTGRALSAPTNGDLTSVALWFMDGSEDNGYLDENGFFVPSPAGAVFDLPQFLNKFPVPVAAPWILTFIALGLIGLGASARRFSKK